MAVEEAEAEGAVVVALAVRAAGAAEAGVEAALVRAEAVEQEARTKVLGQGGCRA